MRKLSQRIKNKGEQQFADLLSQEGKDFIYQPAVFHVGAISYRPDFYVINEETFYEVFTTRQAFFENSRDIALLLRVYPFLKLKIINPDGTPYSRELGVPAICQPIKISRYKSTKKPSDKRLLTDFIEFQKAHHLDYRHLSADSRLFDKKGISINYLYQIGEGATIPMGGGRVEQTLRKLLDFVKQKYSQIDGEKEKPEVSVNA